MAFSTGKGGYLTFNATNFPVIDWETNVENNLADTTNALSPTDPDNPDAAAATNISGPVTKQDGTMNIMWDDAGTPDSLGMSAGLSAASTLQLGPSGLTYVGTIYVKSVRPRVNTREGAIQYALAYQFSGTVARP